MIRNLKSESDIWIWYLKFEISTDHSLCSLRTTFLITLENVSMHRILTSWTRSVSFPNLAAPAVEAAPTGLIYYDLKKCPFEIQAYPVGLYTRGAGFCCGRGRAWFLFYPSYDSPTPDRALRLAARFSIDNAEANVVRREMEELRLDSISRLVIKPG